MAAAPSDARVPGPPVAAPPIPAPPPADGVASWEPIVGAIGPKVRDLRQQHGLSLQQLAQRSGVSAAAIHKVERGDMVPTITTLLKLSAALGTPIGHFVEEGLIIVGWVALWRPLEIFLYDWWPIAQRKRLYRRLADASVSVSFYDTPGGEGLDLRAEDVAVRHAAAAADRTPAARAR